MSSENFLNLLADEIISQEPEYSVTHSTDVEPMYVFPDMGHPSDQGFSVKTKNDLVFIKDVEMGAEFVLNTDARPDRIAEMIFSLFHVADDRIEEVSEEIIE